MPEKKSRKRARTDRKTDAASKFTARSRTLGLFNKRLGPVSLKYHSEIVLDPSTATPAWHVFSANGLFDPDITSTGHQPYGFDQYMAQYNHYTVVGAKITVHYSNVSSTTQPYILTIRTAAGTTPLTNRTQILEAPINITNKFIGSRQGARADGSFSRRVSISKFLSQDVMQEDNNAGFDGVTTGNPAEQVFFHVGAQAYSVFTDAPAITLNVIIEYLAVFHEPKEVLPS